jgi:tetrapyrrole methylase family protein / MazG family protein
MKIDIQKLVDIMDKLRTKDTGCPWDLEQTHESLKRFLIEEAYEVIDSIDSFNPENLKEELGDLLLQVIFHARLAKENKLFTIQDVIDTISNKLIVRHPHVFKEKNKLLPKQVEEQWEKIKANKKEDVLSGIPRHMPSNLKALRVTEKASRFNFDWEKVSDVIKKIKEELKELEEAIKLEDKKEIFHEFGDLLFAVNNLARHLDINPEDAQNKAIDRFYNRFKLMNELSKKRGLDFKSLKLEEMEILWQEAKKILKK